MLVTWQLNNMEPFWFRMPETLIGTGTVDNISSYINKLGVRKVLINTDTGVIQAGLIEKVKKSLENESIAVGIFDKCQPDAPIDTIRNCAYFAKQGNYGLIISIGGGSTIDIGKIAAIMATAENPEQEKIEQYMKTGIPRLGIPKVHIPTTAGSGSEVSWVAVFTDSDKIKKSIASEYLLPKVAIVDPLMSLNLPAKITAESGVDALAHAIEGYTSMKSNVISDMIAETVIKLISENFRFACYNGSKNITVRYNMAIAATFASKVFDISGGAMLGHAMGHSIQTATVCTHGASLSVILPHMMEFNRLKNELKYARIAELVGEKVENLPKHEASQKAVEAVKKLIIDIGAPQKLSQIGVKKEQINKIIENLFTVNTRMLNNNPRECSREDARQILEAAF